jgi:hypothetical protein
MSDLARPPIITPWIFYMKAMSPDGRISESVVQEVIKSTAQA